MIDHETCRHFASGLKVFPAEKDDGGVFGGDEAVQELVELLLCVGIFLLLRDVGRGDVEEGLELIGFEDDGVFVFAHGDELLQVDLLCGGGVEAKRRLAMCCGGKGDEHEAE